MKILLIDVDSKIPNLALMKLSAYNKSIGNEVFLNRCEDPDFVYASAIFEGSLHECLNLKQKYNWKIDMGGSGIDLERTLPDFIEHMMPDYDLYDMDYSMGFSSRGCIRKCKFCIVPKKEGRIHDTASVTEFLHPDHKKLILMDNNFLASLEWKRNLQYIIDNKIKININQGLDFRLLKKEMAEMLGHTMTRSHTFNYNVMYFALDDVKYINLFKEKMKLLLKYVKPYRIMVYILIGFNSTPEDDYRRFELVTDFDLQPYIMPWNKTSREQSEYEIDFTRWVNRRLYKVCKFEDYDGSIRQPRRK